LKEEIEKTNWRKEGVEGRTGLKEDQRKEGREEAGKDGYQGWEEIKEWKDIKEGRISRKEEDQGREKRERKKGEEEERERERERERGVRNGGT
jgi:hypothetical protein